MTAWPPWDERNGGPIECPECGAVRSYPDEPHEPDCHKFPRLTEDGEYIEEPYIVDYAANGRVRTIECDTADEAAAVADALNAVGNYQASVRNDEESR